MLRTTQAIFIFKNNKITFSTGNEISETLLALAALSLFFLQLLIDRNRGITHEGFVYYVDYV